MNTNKRSKLFERFAPLMKDLNEILFDKPECFAFVCAYSDYVECIDDLVDEPHNIELIDKTTFLAEQLFSSNYWLKNCNQLHIVEQLIHIIYFNSVAWENSAESWKQRDAKALSHCAYYMLFAILLLETKDTKLVQKISLQFMERSHLLHFEDMSKELQEA